MPKNREGSVLRQRQKARNDEKELKKILIQKQKTEKNVSSKRIGLLVAKMVFLVVGGIYWYSKQSGGDTHLARSSETVGGGKFQDVECSSEYRKQAQKGTGDCTPTKCGRFVIDDILTVEELDVLTEIAKEGTMIAGGGAGGASIIEMHTSSASSGEQFVSLFNRAKQGHTPTIDKMEKIYSDHNLMKYKEIRKKVQKQIGDVFGINPNKLYLAAPTFFSRLDDKPAKTPNDEYWHKHVDTLQYKVFHYTALFYLNDYGTDFEGGRFIFDKVDNSKEIGSSGIATEQTLEPKRGRLSFFTSGAENPHHVERVTKGTRYAFTMGFTCNADYKISDPALPTEIVNAKVPDS